MRLELILPSNPLDGELREPDPFGAGTISPVRYLVGSSKQVSANTFATVRVERGRMLGGRVLSVSKPSTLSSAKRCRRLRTAGQLAPACRATSCTLRRSNERRTTAPAGRA